MRRRRRQGVAGHRHGGAGDRSRLSGAAARGVAAGIGSLALAESIGDPALTVGLSTAAIYAKGETAEMSDVLRWSQRVIDLADGDPTKGNFIFGSPLALALTTRAIARYWLGRPGWRDDQRQALAMARSDRPRVLRRGCHQRLLLRNIGWGAEARRFRDGRDRGCHYSLPNDPVKISRWPSPGWTLGIALVHRKTTAERDHGRTLLAEVRDVFLRRGHNLAELPIVNVYLARERARHGDRDEAIPLMRAAVDDLVREGQLLAWGVPATGVLVETLLDRGADGDVAEAEAAIDQVGGRASRRGSGDTRHLAAAAAGTAGTSPRRRHRLSRLSGSLPRHGENAWLRGAYRVGRGDAMTACCSFGGCDVFVHRCRGFDPSVGDRRGCDAVGAGRP